MKKLVVIALVLSAVPLLAQRPTRVPMVTVKGKGVVKVVPDEVSVTVRMESEGSSASEVKQANDKVIDNVIKFCREMNIANKDVKTDYMNVNKNYNYNTKQYRYVANQALSIKLQDLDEYETLIQGVLERGVNRIDKISFTSSKMEEHRSEARKKAMANAVQRATEYAEVVDQKIGKAIGISEMTLSPVPQPMLRTMAMESDMASTSASQETVSPGELSVTAKVNVSFELLATED